MRTKDQPAEHGAILAAARTDAVTVRTRFSTQLQKIHAPCTPPAPKLTSPSQWMSWSLHWGMLVEFCTASPYPGVAR